ncbi:CHAT domain-containing protein [Cumulibacter soli]|uniref:CHAT domain-containing protein n=1 Tax=Cumulibacter soli TaxID=2546344 RepID=UPI001ABA5859|nr:CHAT domain-containing protein [Cumulibacter soli]
MHGDLAHARRLAFASDEEAAHRHLLGLIPKIERADRDDWMLEALTQLGDAFLNRSAYEQAGEVTRRIDDVLIQVREHPDSANFTESAISRYDAWRRYLASGLTAAQGNHDQAIQELENLGERLRERTSESRYLLGNATIRCALALGDDDRYAQAAPLWQRVMEELADERSSDVFLDRLYVSAGLGYGGYCVATGNLQDAEEWLQRAAARASALGWRFDVAKAQLERAAAVSSAGNYWAAHQLTVASYPTIAEFNRAHEVSSAWYMFGLTHLLMGQLDEAGQCWDQAELHWREIDKPLQLYRMLLQRSWIPIFRGEFDAATKQIARAREVLEEWPRSNWLHYARLDTQRGAVWRADALSDMGFETGLDPDAPSSDRPVGVVACAPGTPEYRRATRKLATAAELMIPAAIAVDAERYAMIDPKERAQWAMQVSAPMLAGAFAIAYEGGDSALLAELIEYHSVRGAFDTDPSAAQQPEPTHYPQVALPSDDQPPVSTTSLRLLGPAPDLVMDPGRGPILAQHRSAVTTRYGRNIISEENPWATWVRGVDDGIPRKTLMLRYADVGVATYGSLRVVDDPDLTITWALDEPLLLAALEELDAVLPEPRGGEALGEAATRAFTALKDPRAELTFAYRLGALLIPPDAWRRLYELTDDPRPDLFVVPSARLGAVPWGQLAMPTVVPDFDDLIRARTDASTATGVRPAQIAWPDGDITTLTDGFRLMELVDIGWAVPANVTARRTGVRSKLSGPDRPLLILDPRVPGHRADGPLGSVLGRPRDMSAASRYFAEVLTKYDVRPFVDTAVELFRRRDVNRTWLASELARKPTRLMYVGHASGSTALDGQSGAEDAAIHLACSNDEEGYADAVDGHRPMQVRDLLELQAPIPPKVALVACASGSDVRYDESAGLVAAFVIGGAELVTATLWSMPTTAGFAAAGGNGELDPMAELVIAVDTAQRTADPRRRLNRWQRQQMRAWRNGEPALNPIYWAALANFEVGPIQNDQDAT